MNDEADSKLATTGATRMTTAETIEKPPASKPLPQLLKGRFVGLLPLDPVVHGEALYEGTHGPERESVWKYLFEGPFPDRSTFDNYLQRAAGSTDPFFLAIVDNTTKLAVGWAAFLRIEPLHRVIEVGHILYTPRLQRTAGATEAMYLMARYVFEDLGYRRYEWKCNSQNAPSLRAARRFGFTFEGIFRQHMIVKGLNRDTAWFSMLDSEWPLCKSNFERWLAPENFSEDGQQRVPLSVINSSRVRE